MIDTPIFVLGLKIVGVCLISEREGEGGRGG